MQSALFQEPSSADGNHREAIKYALRVRGMTLADVGKAMNVSGSTVSIVIKGERRSRRVAEYVATVLNASVDDVFPGLYTNGETRR